MKLAHPSVRGNEVFGAEQLDQFNKRTRDA